MLLSIQQGLVNIETGDTTMFGILSLVRYARRLHANSERARREKFFLDLPVEIQKDIGWPRMTEEPTTIANRPAERCSPVR